MSDYERYGHPLNPTPEQARNRRERREAQNARADANRAHYRTQELIDENRRLIEERDRLRAELAARTPEAQRDAEPPDARFHDAIEATLRHYSGWDDVTWESFKMSLAARLAATQPRATGTVGQRDAGNLADGPA